MIEYYNYLTIPSGKGFNLKELKNKEYLVLLKFLNGENYKGFYEALDSLIQESIPDFKDFNLCDKAYIYIAYYYYSINSTLTIKGDKVDSVDIPLTIMLDSLENSFIKNKVSSKVNNWDACIYYPKQLLFDSNDDISIDKFSGLCELANNPIKDITQLEQLRSVMPTKYINEIEYIVDKNFNSEITICEDSPNTSKLTDTLLSPSLFYSIAYMYKELLDNFYDMQYMVAHYIRVSIDSLLEMTPVETNILYKNFIRDKERQNEKSKSSGSSGLHLNDPNIADSLMGY